MYVSTVPVAALGCDDVDEHGTGRNLMRVRLVVRPPFVLLFLDQPTPTP